MSDISDLQGKVKVSDWLKNMITKDVSTQKSELRTLFTQIQDEKLTDEQRTGLLESKNSLTETVEKLEAELAVLDDDMTKKEKEIDSLSNQIATLVLNVRTKTNNIETDQKKHAKEVVNEVLNKRKNNPDYGVNAMVADMNAGMKQFVNNSEYKNLQYDLSALTAKENKIQELVASAANLIDSKNNLEKRFGVTKSTYDLITSNLNAASLEDKNYTNADLGTDKPIYSATKLETLVPYFDNTSINVEAGANSNYKQGTTAPNPTLDSIKTKYKNYLKTAATANVDSYSYNNAAVQNLGKAINEGMLTDLKLSGVSGTKLINFLTENFANANIVKGDNGTLKIPYGHGVEANKVFSALTDFVKVQNLGNDASSWNNDHFKGIENTWDKNKGNTLSTNKQIKSLSENFDTIATSMKDKGFTFKEAMYAMFDPNNGLFKNSGIIYDTSKQSDSLKYFIEFAGDDATAAAYKNVAKTIYENWGVKPIMCVDYDNYNGEGLNDTPTESYDGTDTVKRTDPLSFVDGNSEYTFIVDRDKDGRFEGKSEFIGGSGSTSWLDDLKTFDTDGNGAIEGDELSKLKILKSQISDNDKVTKKGNAQSQTTKIGYEFTNAKDLGIEKIDLNGLEDKVNKSTGRKDVNNSEAFKDSFNFTLNGKEVTAKRKDDTDEYMNTVYGNAYGTRFDNKAGLTEEEINNTIDKDYKEFDDVMAKHSDFENKKAILGGLKSEIGQTSDYVNTTADASDAEVKSIIRQGQNRAQSYYGDNAKWSDIKADVIAAGQSKGVDTSSSDFLIQTEGIYIMNGTLSADEIVDEYIKTQDTINASETRRKNSETAFKGMIACAKVGISVEISDVLKLMEKGTVKTEEEILKYYQAQNRTEK